MELLIDVDPIARSVFGREVLPEDRTNLGRWAYAATWLADTEANASALYRAHLALMAEAAMASAGRAGHGGEKRLALVTALARLTDALKDSQGPMVEPVQHAVARGALLLMEDCQSLRAATAREWTLHVPRVSLLSFEMAIKDDGPDRNVVLREVFQALEEARAEATQFAPAIELMWRYLSLTLEPDDSETVSQEDLARAATSKSPIPRLFAWIAADQALLSRRAGAYGSAWFTAATRGGDALSRLFACLSAGSWRTVPYIDALAEDPWALVTALAMTSTKEEADMLLTAAIEAQASTLKIAAKRLGEWRTQALAVSSVEERTGIAVLSDSDDRHGHEGLPSLQSMDLFSLWSVVERASNARTALKGAIDRAIAGESTRRHEALRRARARYEAEKKAYDLSIEAAQRAHRERETEFRKVFNDQAGDGSSAQKGCMLGMGAGCSVVSMYLAAGVILGTGGLIGHIGPLVVGVAAVPCAAALFVQIVYHTKRAAAAAEMNRKNARSLQVLERAREQAEQKHGTLIFEAEQTLEAAERAMNELEEALGVERQSA